MPGQRGPIGIPAPDNGRVTSASVLPVLLWRRSNGHRDADNRRNWRTPRPSASRHRQQRSRTRSRDRKNGMVVWGGTWSCSLPSTGRDTLFFDHRQPCATTSMFEFLNYRESMPAIRVTPFLQTRSWWPKRGILAAPRLRPENALQGSPLSPYRLKLRI